MQVDKPLFFALINPSRLKPMHGAGRVAVKPPLTSRDRTAACGLVDEALRHERYLIKESACRRNALNQILRSFIFAAEDIKVIGPAFPGHLKHVRRIA